MTASAQTVAQALAEFLAAHRMDRRGYKSRVLLVRLGPIALPFPNPGFLPVHDLHHVVLGAPPTFWGEVEVSAFELRSGPPSALVALLCVGALVLGGLLAPRRVWAMWKRHRGAVNLYRRTLGLSYAAALALDLESLRAMMLGAEEKDKEEGLRC